MIEDRFGPCPHCQMGGPGDPGVCTIPEGMPLFSDDMAGNTLVLCRYCGITFEQTVVRGSAPPVPPPPEPMVMP